jgi:Kef-type K+ transport system membrane component KefB
VGSFSILPIGTYAASANFHQPRDTTAMTALINKEGVDMYFELSWLVLIVLAVQDLALAVACAVLAESRGRSAGAFFLLGLLLPVVGLVLVLGLPPEWSPPEPRRRP